MRVTRTKSIATHTEGSFRFTALAKPSVIVLGDGGTSLMVGFIDGEHGAGDVYTTLSPDGGHQWTEPRLLVRADRTSYRSVALFFQDRRCYAFVETTHPGTKAGLVAFTSEDLGMTWSESPIQVPDSAPVVVSGRLVTYRGRHVLPVHSVEHGAQPTQSVLASDDLVHWDLGGSVAGSDGTITHTQPGERQDGLIMVMREPPPPNPPVGCTDSHAQFSLSTDCGVSWSPTQPFLEVPCPTERAFFATDSLGRYVAIFNTGEEPRTLKCRVREPRGPWGPVHDVAAPGRRHQNVDGVECAPGRFFCVFESDPSTITFADVQF